MGVTHFLLVYHFTVQTQVLSDFKMSTKKIYKNKKTCSYEFTMDYYFAATNNSLTLPVDHEESINQDVRYIL